LLEYHEKQYTYIYEASMIETINENLDSLDFDNPYLDEFEEDYLENSELDFEN